jgi:hypothetical protein
MAAGIGSNLNLFVHLRAGKPNAAYAPKAPRPDLRPNVTLRAPHTSFRPAGGLLRSRPFLRVPAHWLRAASRSRCSKADAMRSISILVRPCRAASSRHFDTAFPTCATIVPAAAESSPK